MDDVVDLKWWLSKTLSFSTLRSDQQSIYILHGLQSTKQSKRFDGAFRLLHSGLVYQEVACSYFFFHKPWISCWRAAFFGVPLLPSPSTPNAQSSLMHSLLPSMPATVHPSLASCLFISTILLSWQTKSIFWFEITFFLLFMVLAITEPPALRGPQPTILWVRCKV